MLHIAEMLQVLHMVERLQVLHMVEMLQVLHMVEMLQMLHMVERLQTLHIVEMLQTLHMLARFRCYMQIFTEALKMAENHEKQCFTFFAFLAPYIVVSGSLVRSGRYSAFFSIVWYQKLSI